MIRMTRNSSIFNYNVITLILMTRGSVALTSQVTALTVSINSD